MVRSTTREVPPAHSLGRVPVRALEDRSMKVRAVRADQEAGRGPVRRLPERVMLSRDRT